MSTQTIGAQIRWQDLKVKSELEIVLEMAKLAGWKDCEVFGSGDMLTQPQQSTGWELIPADQYKYSIPTEAVARLHQVINAGVRVKGVIIADDQRHEQPAPVPALVKPRVVLPSVKPIASALEQAWRGSVQAVRAVISFLGRIPHGLIHAVEAVASFLGEALLELTAAAGAFVSFLGRALLGLLCVAGVIVLLAIPVFLFIHFGPVSLLSLFILPGIISSITSSTSSEYDPKLVILVDDGNGGTAWVSLFTWYD